MDLIALAASATPPVPESPSLWKSAAEALLIGLIFGAQRETSLPASASGLRDFLMVAMIGAVCGMLGQPLVTVAAMGVAALAWPHFHDRPDETSGLTTRLAAIATFLLSALATMPGVPEAEPVALALAVIAAGVLEMKRQVHKFFREVITDAEFNDTLKFLGIVFVIYPLLPDGRFGPYGAFEPRKIWVFVILLSSISYVGYFLEKFVGGTWGLRLTALLGGLSSTTAATGAFAKDARENPHRMVALWQATTLANAIQFPRVLTLIAALNWPLAYALFWPLLAMAAAGVVVSFLPLPSGPTVAPGAPTVPLRNPFRLRPALRFGLVFAVMMVATRAAAAVYGEAALLVTSMIGGLIDVDGIVVSTSEVQAAGRIGDVGAKQAILLALAMNAVFKTGLAYAGRNGRFGVRVLLSFVVMLSAGALTLWLS